MCAVLFTSCSSNEDAVVIFSSMEQNSEDALKAQLKEKFPDIPVRIQHLSTGNNTAKIKAEGENTEADIVLGLETPSMLKIADRFATLDEYTKDQYADPSMITDDRIRPWEVFEGAILVNTEVLKEHGLPEPKTYEDLLNPAYKGMIAMPSPKTSSTAYMFLNSWVKTMGEDGAFDYVDKLQKNIKQFTESGSGPVNMLKQGEIAVGLGIAYLAADQITQGVPLKIIAPETGCPYTSTSFGIVKGKEKDENVKKIFTFLNEDFMKYNVEHITPGKLLKDQQVKLKNYPENLPAADMSTINDLDLKDKLTEKWKY